jgi:holin-like protein
MTLLNGITALLVFQLIGELLVRYFGVPVPGPVVGMVLLFVVLLIWRGPIQSLDTASSSLLSHLSLLFVPAGVGIILHFDRIANEWLAIGVALLASTILTMCATALIMYLGSRYLVRRS